MCFPGLAYFVTAIAYRFFLNFYRAFTKSGKTSFGDACTYAFLKRKKNVTVEKAGRMQDCMTSVSALASLR